MKYALFLIALTGFGQIVVTPPVPPAGGTAGKVVVTAGTINCTITGDAVPAAGIQVACTVAGTVIAPYHVTIATQQNFTLNHVHLPPAPASADAVTCLFAQAATAGQIKFDCSSVTANTESHATGTF